MREKQETHDRQKLQERDTELPKTKTHDKEQEEICSKETSALDNHNFPKKDQTYDWTIITAISPKQLRARPINGTNRHSCWVIPKRRASSRKFLIMMYQLNKT